jgi:hypothetical protein
VDCGLKKSREVWELREIIFQIFSSIAKNVVPQEKDIARFNKKLSRMMRQSKLEIVESGIEWNVN